MKSYAQVEKVLSMIANRRNDNLFINSYFIVFLTSSLVETGFCLGYIYKESVETIYTKTTMIRLDEF